MGNIFKKLTPVGARSFALRPGVKVSERRRRGALDWEDHAGLWLAGRIIVANVYAPQRVALPPEESYAPAPASRSKCLGPSRVYDAA